MFEKLMLKLGYTKVKPKGKPGRKPRDPNAVRVARKPRAKKVDKSVPIPTEPRGYQPLAHEYPPLNAYEE